MALRAVAGWFCYFRYRRYLSAVRGSDWCFRRLRLEGYLLTLRFQLGILLLKLPQPRSLTTQPQQFVLIGLRRCNSGLQLLGQTLIGIL